jgi:hypothetical protein
MGRETNAQSGRAILARQEQGNIITLELFDNLRLAIQRSGQIMLSLVEQYYTDHRIFRLTDEQGGFSFLEINGQNDKGEALNDITARQADFVIDTQSWSATMRQRAFEVLGEITTRLPIEISINLMDLMFDLSDFPLREELVQRMRKMNGQADPDAEKDPEQQELLKKKAQAEEKAAALAQAQQELGVRLKQLEAEKMQAEIEAKKSGIAFDQQKLQLEKAKTANEIARGIASDELEVEKAASENQGPYDERGMKSNNRGDTND